MYPALVVKSRNYPNATNGRKLRNVTLTVQHISVSVVRAVGSISRLAFMCSQVRFPLPTYCFTCFRETCERFNNEYCMVTHLF